MKVLYTATMLVSIARQSRPQAFADGESKAYRSGHEIGCIDATNEHCYLMTLGLACPRLDEGSQLFRCHHHHSAQLRVLETEISTIREQERSERGQQLSSLGSTCSISTVNCFASFSPLSRTSSCIPSIGALKESSLKETRIRSYSSSHNVF